MPECCAEIILSTQQQQQQQPLFYTILVEEKKGGKETKYRKQNDGRFIVIYIQVCERAFLRRGRQPEVSYFHF